MGAFQQVGMAAHAFGVPVAVVNFVDREKVLTRSAVRYENLTEVDRKATICSLASLTDQVTVFEDARQDPCLLGNPFVHGEFGLQFYAAAPLRTKDGFNIGVLAIADTKPRQFPEAEATLLGALAAMAMEELEERKSLL